MADEQHSPKEHENEAEKQQRQLGELLQELRVALPGVQILVAFLLTIPFQARFTTITSFQKSVYFVTLLCSVASVAFLIAPSAYHRVLFHQGQRERLISYSNKMAVIGLALLAVAMTGVVLLITDRLYNGSIIWMAAGGAFILFATLWYLIPLGRRARINGDSD